MLCNWKIALTVVATFFSLEVISQKSISYGNTNEHARAICRKGKVLYVGTNLGHIYEIKGEICKLITTDSFPEIRDIQWDRGKLFVMQTGNIGKMICLKKGKSGNFSKVRSQIFQKGEKSVFLDGFHIKKSNGLLMGDPIENKFSLFRLGSKEIWEELPELSCNQGEAAFAASGSTVQLSGNDWYFISGGQSTRLFHSKNKGKSWDVRNVPFASCESCGAYSMCLVTSRRHHVKSVFCVGGDYMLTERRTNTCFYFNFKDSTWNEPRVLPNGYRSVIVYNKKSKVLFCGGTNGIDYSLDFGNTWKSASIENCFAMVCFGKGIVFTSNFGRIIHLNVRENSD